MQYRHEWKHEINYMDLLVIRQRLSAIASPDHHAKDGIYRVRSLYFDTPEDKALREKLDGVDRREKFRIRYYDDDLSFIRLEKKSKKGGLGTKVTAPLTREQAQNIVEGELSWMCESEDELVKELYHRMRAQRLRPRTIVDYTRQPFVYAPGNVRVTLDYEIRTGLVGIDFLRVDCPTVPVRGNPIILEVKWDNYLPGIIRDAVQLSNRRSEAFSKYAACRMYD